jgi:hypothetical protein
LADFAVHADDETGDDAGGEDVVVVLEGEGGLPVSGFGFFFGQESRNEESLVGVTIDRKAEIKLSHDVDQEAVFVAGIAARIEDGGQVGEAEDAVVSGEEFIVVEDFVDAVGDPGGFEDVGFGEFGVEADVVFLEVEDDAQIMEEFEQVGLGFGVCNSGCGADLFIVHRFGERGSLRGVVPVVV